MPDHDANALLRAYERRALAAEAALIKLRRDHADELEMARVRARYAENKHAALLRISRRRDNSDPQHNLDMAAPVDEIRTEDALQKIKEEHDAKRK